MQTDNHSIPSAAAETPAENAGGKPGKGKKFLLILLAAVVLFGAYRIVSSRLGTEQTEDEKNAVNVHVVTAERMDIKVETPLSGKVEPEDQVSVIATLQSEVTGVYVEVGDYVNAGATLFTQDAGQIQGSYQQASASVNIAREALSSAKTNYERMELLYREGAVSQQSYDGAKTQYATAQEQLNQAQAALTTAADALGNATATAPISGYITEVNVTAGTFPNMAAAAVSIANTKELEINTSVSEYLIGKIQTGQQVDVVINSLSDKLYQGTITNVAPAPSMGTLTYPITIKINGDQSGIVAGMFAEVHIVSDSRENVIAVPSESVLIKSGETQVVVLDQDNVPSFVSVTTGLDNGSMVEIIDGLSEGQIVVSSGQNFVVEGEAVTIQDPDGQSKNSSDDQTKSRSGDQN